MKKRSCPDCGGVGFYYHVDDICQKCNGSGFVVREINPNIVFIFVILSCAIIAGMLEVLL